MLLRGMCDATYSAIKVNTKPNSVSPTRKLKPKKYAGEGSVVVPLLYICEDCVKSEMVDVVWVFVLNCQKLHACVNVCVIHAPACAKVNE